MTMEALNSTLDIVLEDAFEIELTAAKLASIGEPPRSLVLASLEVPPIWPNDFC